MAAFCLSTRALIEQQGIRGSDITAVSFSAQMNACLPVDGAGQPLRPAMIWADQRASAEAERLIRALGREALYRRTAQPLSASHGVCKMAWLKDNEPDIYGKTAKFLQAKDYVACCLTGGMHSDPSDASHLGCYDLHDLRWLPEVLREAGIAEEKLPELLPSTAVAGHEPAGAVPAAFWKAPRWWWAAGTALRHGGGGHIRPGRGLCVPRHLRLDGHAQRAACM